MWRSNSVIRWWETRQAAFDDIYTEMAGSDETQPISHSFKQLSFLRSKDQTGQKGNGELLMEMGESDFLKKKNV